MGRILVIGDNPRQAELLDNCLLPMGYQVLHVYDGDEAMQSIETDRPDLVIVDLGLPGDIGYEICRSIKASDSTGLLPVVMLAATADTHDKIRGLEAGTDDFISGPFDDAELLARIGSLLRMKQLTDELDTVRNVLFSLVLAMEARDEFTKGHSERVARWSERLGLYAGLEPQVQRVVQTAGLLHDIGKMNLSEAVLRKPGPLTPEEREQISAHVVEGERICRPLRFARLLLPAIRHHHERYDGAGYPDGLSGEHIPREARILAVADAYDAMTSVRPYRPAMSRETALAVLQAGAGSQWDPNLVVGFVSLVEGTSIS